MIPGIDCLGAADSDWSMKLTVEAWRKGFAFGIFDGKETFGAAVPAIRRLFNEFQRRGRVIEEWVPAVRIHACWNNHGLIPESQLTERCEKYKILLRLYPRVRWYISHTCEYSKMASKKELSRRVSIIKKMLPKAIPVLSPEPGAEVLAYTVIERHGDDAKVKAGQIASTDGQALFDINAKQWLGQNSKAEIIFAWGHRLNLSEAGPKILPPYKRTARPNAEYLTSLIRLFDAAPEVPTATYPLIPLSKPLLLKTHAEDMPGDNSRDNKPLLILPFQAPKVDIVTYNNIRLGEFKYYGDFPGGMHRYYASLAGMGYGYQIADEAIQVSGSPYCAAKHGDKYYGLFHPTFRQGYFQD